MLVEKLVTSIRNGQRHSQILQVFHPWDDNYNHHDDRDDDQQDDDYVGGYWYDSSQHVRLRLGVENMDV